MDFGKNIISYLNKIYRQDAFVLDITSAFSRIFEQIYVGLEVLRGNFFFDTLNEDGILWWENLLGITPIHTQTHMDRRFKIQAKWLSNSHNDIKLIQRICNAWKNGEVVADFVGGKIQIQFVGAYGVPSDLETLKISVDEVKPAHLGLVWVFKYLLKKNIDNVLTKAQMQTYRKNEYCNVEINGGE